MRISGYFNMRIPGYFEVRKAGDFQANTQEVFQGLLIGIISLVIYTRAVSLLDAGPTTLLWQLYHV